jgi:hypothetical protein
MENENWLASPTFSELSPVAKTTVFLILLSIMMSGCMSSVALPPPEEVVVEEEYFPLQISKEMLAPNSEYSTGSGKPLYRVWYGTNRKPGYNANNSFLSYTEERDYQIHYGKCYVEIPESHEFGSVGSS